MATLERFVASDRPRLGRAVQTTIQRQGLVALPTETFYGLAVDPFSEQAVARLLRVKRRVDEKPVLILIGDRVHLSLLAAQVSDVARLLMECLWPGALTILFPAHPSLPRNLTAATGLVGIRLSPCEPLTGLLNTVGPVTGTSANRSGAHPATSAQEVQNEFGDEIDLIIDAGRTPGGQPSTVIDAGHPVRLIREGAVSRQTIQNVLQTRGLSLA
jgi:L-threonylcarbamoyladenylate synthase